MSIKEQSAKNPAMTLPVSQESSALLHNHNGKRSARARHPSFFGSFSNTLLPGVWDVETIPNSGSSMQQRSQHLVQPRSLRRRIFLILTEPHTSIVSAFYFVILVVSIAFINLLMIIQTMEEFQYTPDNCKSCGGSVVYVFDFGDGSDENKPDGVECVCPPEPLPFTNIALKWLIYFFTVEFVLRLLMFAPPPTERSPTKLGFVWQWFGFLLSWGTIFDALAIFPYYIEALTYSNSLISLRLLRLFRVFQVVRLGQYSDSFLSLSTVLVKAVPYLKLLLALLVFGATIFGSLLYWTEKGEWKYFDETATYEYVRLNDQGIEEISPFTSIPSAFWWFTVTATTVG